MRVLVAMSGGVDSSVAAARLVAAGHEVTGATLKLWGGESDTGCCSIADVSDARRVADRLGIDHHTFSYAEEFTVGVVDPYVAAHAAGRTPNPCIACNREVKFGALLERAERLGFDAVATGHHARVLTGPDGVRRVGRGADAAKDQAYVLAGLDHERLGRVLFPVGSSSKAEVRAEAERAGLLTADKPDSQDVCFVTRAEGRVRFLGRRTALTPGVVVDASGRVLGRVPAVEAVTVGQRRGLGLAGGGEPRFVVDVDVAGARVVVAPEAELAVASQPVTEIGWADGPVSTALAWQVSAHGEPRRGRFVAGEGGASGGGVVEWSDPGPRVAPGQAMVAFDGDVVVGWATAVAGPGTVAPPAVAAPTDRPGDVSERSLRGRFDGDSTAEADDRAKRSRRVDVAETSGAPARGA